MNTEVFTDEWYDTWNLFQNNPVKGQNKKGIEMKQD